MNEDEIKQALTARIAVAAPEGGTELKAGSIIEGMFMPAGTHECTFGVLGRNQAVTRQIKITSASAKAMNDQLAAVKASGQRPYFDFDHKGEAASMWPLEFFWRDQPAGVFYRAEASGAGAQGIAGKNYRAFSPVFYPDSASDPAGIACNPDADLNFGGLVNDPAFKAISPLWAKTPAGATSSDPKQTDMEKTKEDLVALQASVKKLEQDIAGLTAKANGGDAVAAADLRAARSELRAVNAELQSAESQKDALAAKNKTTELETADKNRRVKFADESIKDAIKRGALKPKDEPLIAKYRKLIEDDPDNLVMLAGLPGDPALAGGRVTSYTPHQVPGGVIEGPRNTMKAYAALVAKNTGIQGLDSSAFRDKGALALEMAGLYAKAVKEHGVLFTTQPLIAADYADPNNNLGTLSGTLVAQRTIELFKYDLPIVDAIYTDFSDSPAQFKQTETTRVIVVPPVMAYNPAINANTGMPWGWQPSTAGQTTDVPITLDEHVGIPIVFDGNTLASTARKLFDEQAPAASYALAKYFVEKIYKLLTPANYNAYAVANGTTVKTAYATFAKGLGDFGRNALVDVAVALDDNLVPAKDRFVLVNSQYHGQLEKDPSLTTFFYGQQAPGVVTERQLPRMAGFQPIKAPNLTVNNNTPNLVGFAGHKAGVVIKSRLSNDYTQALPGASFGNVTTITNPDSGFSVVLVQYVDHNGGFAAWRIQVMLGAAVGDKRGGLPLTSI